MVLTTKFLLSHGYFPKELPPSFQTEQFGAFIGKNAPFNVTPALSKIFITRPAVHNLARPSGQRRRLHIPNPFSYYLLSELLAANWKRIEKHCAKSKLSVSTPSLDPSGMRAVKAKFEGSELARHRARIRRTGRWIVRTDISRFYSSIYTHSIPWALEGKAVAKKVRKGGFANDLDARLRELQDGQTLGIPTGPDASLIVAEIVATAVDQQLQKAKLVGMRFIDDYELVFYTRAAADAGLAKLEEILADYELAINLRKTSVQELPVELDRQWTAELKNFDFPILFEGDEVPSDELIRYFNKAFELKLKHPHDPVLAYAIARLRSMRAEDWDLLQDLLCQCAFVEHGAMDALVTHFEKNKDRGLSDALDNAIASILAQGAPLTHGTELAWALWAAIWFKRPIPAKLAKKLDGNPDAIIAVLALHAKELGLIKKSVTFPIWASLMRQSSLYGPQWLLAYEADMQGWLPSAERPNHVDNDPNFSQLKASGINFYNTKIAAPTKSLLHSVTDAEPDDLS